MRNSTQLRGLEKKGHMLIVLSCASFLSLNESFRHVTMHVKAMVLLYNQIIYSSQRSCLKPECPRTINRLNVLGTKALKMQNR